MEAADRRFLKTFGLAMRTLREKRGWTLEETESYGWNAWTHLQQIESGKKNISLITIVKLSKLYKISISKLFENM